MENAKLSPKAAAFAGALLWGSGVFLVAREPVERLGEHDGEETEVSGG